MGVVYVQSPACSRRRSLFPLVLHVKFSISNFITFCASANLILLLHSAKQKIFLETIPKL